MAHRSTATLDFDGSTQALRTNRALTSGAEVRGNAHISKQIGSETSHQFIHDQPVGLMVGTIGTAGTIGTNLLR